MSQNIEIGDHFENRIAALLRSSTGYRNVQQQVSIQGVNVDIVFEKKWNPQRYKTIVIECKYREKRVSREILKDIIADYGGISRSSKIDEVWIVTNNQPSSSTIAYLEGFPEFSLFTIQQIEQDIINFDAYLSHIVSSFDDSPLSNYYIEPRTLGANGVLLRDTFMSWLSRRDCRPLAVWAGYGMGKTSFAQRISSELAKSYMSGKTERIPILIPLGDYYTSPRIDGLIANVLTRDHGVHGYSYGLFQQLLAAGRLLIILDGFDEMKHAMSNAEFMAFSKEIRKLSVENSKVVILGRPDIFITDEEHLYFTTGTRASNSIIITDENNIEAEEVRIDYLTKAEFMQLIEGYIAAQNRLPSDVMRKRIAEIDAVNIDDILTRPVQAKMYASIIANPKNMVDISGKFELYEAFISECINREQEKDERRKTSASDRREFMRDVAWWLWTVKRTRTFNASEIPEVLISKYGPRDDSAPMLRELLIGSLIEERNVGALLSEKMAGVFYFPHQSFTEFLVAEYIIYRKLNAANYSQISGIFSGEIENFLRSYTKGDLRLTLFNAISEIDGHSVEISPKFLRFMNESKAVARILNNTLSSVNSKGVYAAGLVLLLDNGDVSNFRAHLQKGIVSGDHNFQMLSIQVALIASNGGHLDKVQAAYAEIVKYMFRNISVERLLRAKSSRNEYEIPLSEFFRALFRNMNVDKAGQFFTIDEAAFSYCVRA